MMKKFALLFLIFMCYAHCSAQTIEDPAFERCDIPTFHIKKVEITKDTTYVYCSYYAEEGSCAAISRETYLQDAESKKVFPLQRCEGIPYSPEERQFNQNDSCDFLFCFPSITGTKQFDFIESEDKSAFNVYGIKMTEQNDSVYSYNQFCNYAVMADSCRNKDINNAIIWKINQLKAANYLYGRKSLASSEVMNDICLLYSDLGENEKAIDWGLQAVSLIEDFAENNEIKEALAREYGTLMTLFAIIKDIDSSALYGERSLEMRKTLNRNNSFYFDFLDRLITLYHSWGNYPKAIMHSEELIRVYNNLCIEDSTYTCDYIASLSDLSIIYYEARNYEKALFYANHANDMLEKGKCIKPQHKIAVYSIFASILAVSAREDGDTLKIDRALDFLNKAIKVTEDNGMGNSIKKISLLLSMGRLYEHIKHNSNYAIQLYEKALVLLDDSVNNSNIAIRAEIIESLADVYRPIDKNKHSFYREKALELKKEIYGEHSLSYGDVLMYRAAEVFRNEILPAIDNNSEDLNQILSTLSKLVNESSSIIKDFLKNSLLLVSDKERNAYWEQYRELFDWLIPNIAFFFPKDNFCSLAYDASLFSKGFMLESSNSIKSAFKMGSASDNKVFQLYMKNLQTLDEWNNNSDISDHELDSLKIIIREQEYLLTKIVNQYGFDFRKSNITWKDVQNTLKDGEVAIEFISFKGVVPSLSPSFLAALVIDNKCELPSFYRLPIDDNDYAEIINSDSIQEQLLSERIWTEELLNAIGDAQTIYFSTSGFLNTVAIEYLPIKEEIRMMDKYCMYRLSSTEELCYHHSPAYSKAALFGGLNYEKNYLDFHINADSLNTLPLALSRAISERGGFDYLPNTAIEVKEINSILTTNNIKCSSYIGNDGTEIAVRNLSSIYPNIIHFATHGMFVDTDNIIDYIKKQNLKFLKQSDSKEIDEDVSMTHSFLVMSGGNSLIHRDSVLTTFDDGILTAKEISFLSFSNLDLVVLSGCQTGFGDYSSEGVYGLQRAFKKAGARTILMSLDKVDDEATRILMVEFYRNLMNGKTKRQSLQEAQQYLRKVDNGKYDNPKYWASFIMLDGLN